EVQSGTARIGRHSGQSNLLIDVGSAFLEGAGVDSRVSNAYFVEQGIREHAALAGHRILRPPRGARAEPGHEREAGAGERLEEITIAEAVAQRERRARRSGRVIDAQIVLIATVGRDR